MKASIKKILKTIIKEVVGDSITVTDFLVHEDGLIKVTLIGDTSHLVNSLSQFRYAHIEEITPINNTVELSFYKGSEDNTLNTLECVLLESSP